MTASATIEQPWLTVAETTAIVSYVVNVSIDAVVREARCGVQFFRGLFLKIAGEYRDDDNPVDVVVSTATNVIKLPFRVAIGTFNFLACTASNVGTFFEDLFGPLPEGEACTPERADEGLCSGWNRR